MNSQSFCLKSETKAVVDPHLSVGQIIYNSLKNQLSSEREAFIDSISGSALTFEDAFKKSIKLAQGFRNLGLKKNEIVTIISRNCYDYFIPCVACAYLGVSVNLLNPEYTKRELQHAIEIVTPVLIISCPEKLSNVAEIQKDLPHIKLINFEELPNFETFADDFEPEKSVDVKEDVFLILCSSGTTGLPKAVALTNLNVKYTLIYCQDKKYFGIDSNESLIGMLPFYHILGFLVPFAGIAFGAKCVILPKFKPDLFLQLIQMHQITKLIIVPSLAAFLAKTNLTDNYDLNSLADVICGGAPLRLELQTALEQKLGVKVRQAYGLTETAAISMTPTNGKNIPGCSGSLVCNYTAKIVDLTSGQPLGPNEPGELCCKGPTIMKGYLANDQATKEIFDEEGFLYTGDIGYYDEDGYIYIVDRLKELIKYKGFQVPPAELENILMTHAEVEDVGVIGIEDERAGELPRAFVVKARGSTLTENQIKEFVAEQVSIQKQLHGGVQFVESIPKNGVGKILRRELKKLVLL